MHWCFCSEACAYEWQLRRHDADVVEWLKSGAGERAKVLESWWNEGAHTQATDTRRRFASLCLDSRLALSMCARAELPPTGAFSQCGGCRRHRGE